MSGNLRAEMEKSRPEYCIKCGTEYKPLGFGKYLCPSCGHLEFDDYGKVRDYLEKNQGMITDMISSATGVKPEFIDSLITDGVLRIADEYAAGLACQRCDRPIRQGRFCVDCIEELAGSILEQYPKRIKITEAKKLGETLKPGYRSTRKK